MSLFTQWEGDVKSGKTISLVFWTRDMLREMDIGCMTNMQHAEYPRSDPEHARPWARTITMNDIIRDAFQQDEHKWKIKQCVLMLTELHTMLSSEGLSGTRKQAMTNLFLQAAKRGVIINFDSHLEGMILPKLRELVQLRVYCELADDPDIPEGDVIYWDVFDPRELRKAAYFGYYPPPPVRLVLSNGSDMFDWYDADESSDPVAAARSIGATKAQRKMIAEIEAMDAEDEARLAGKSDEYVDRKLTERLQRIGEEMNDKPGDRHPLAEVAAQTARETLAKLEPVSRGRRPMPVKHFLSGR